MIMATGTVTMVSPPEGNNESFSGGGGSKSLSLDTGQSTLLKSYFTALLAQNNQYGKMEVVDDNARMHRTQSYYRIELTSSLPSAKPNKWRPQDPVVGGANTTKDRWGLVKKTSTVSLDSKSGGDDDIADASSSSGLFLKKPKRRGSIDVEFADLDKSPSGSSRNSIKMASPQQKSSKKSERKQAKRKVTKSKTKKRKEEKKKAKELSVEQKQQARQRRNPQTWEKLLSRSESFGPGERDNINITNSPPAVTPSMGKRKSAPSIFTPMCKSKTLVAPSRTFSPPWTAKPLEMSDFIDNSEGHDGDDEVILPMAGIPKPSLFDSSDDDDDNDEFKNIDARRSVQSYNAIFEIVQNTQTSGDESLGDDTTLEWEEYELPLEHSLRSNDRTVTTNDNENTNRSTRSTDVSNRSERTVESFQRKPPQHTNSFELTHRRSVVRQSLRRRVVKMTPQDLQTRISDIQLTEEHSSDGALKMAAMDDYEDDDDLPLNPPTLCENDYTSSGENDNDYTSSGDYTSSAEDDEDFL